MHNSHSLKGILISICCLLTALVFAQKNVDQSKGCDLAAKYADQFSLDNKPIRQLGLADSAKMYSKNCSDEIKWRIEKEIFASHFLLGNTDKAQEIVLKAIRTFKNSSPSIRSMVYNQASIIYSEIGNTEKGFNYLGKSLEIAKKYELEDLSGLYCNYAGFLFSMGKPQEALINLKESERADHFSQENGQGVKISRAMIYAKIYDSLKLQDKLEEVIQEGLLYVALSDDYYFKSTFWAYVGFKRLEQQAYSEVLPLCDSIVSYSGQGVYPQGEIYAFQLRSEYYKKTGQLDLSIKNIESMMSVQDSLDVVARENREALVDQNMELLENEFKLKEDKLNAELEIKRERNNKSKLLIITLSIILAVLCIAFIFYIRNRRLVQKKQQLERREKTMVQEIEQKKGDLTSKVLWITKMNSFLVDLANDLEEKSSDFPNENKGFLKPIVKKVRRHSETGIWQEFDLRLKQLHREFYSDLISDFPNLTNNERRLCSFIKLDMNVKEISNVTGQTPHSIRVARVRLRKKFELTNTEVSLEAFLEKYG